MYTLWIFGYCEAIQPTFPLLNELLVKTKSLLSFILMVFPLLLLDFLIGNLLFLTPWLFCFLSKCYTKT